MKSWIAAALSACVGCFGIVTSATADPASVQGESRFVIPAGPDKTGYCYIYIPPGLATVLELSKRKLLLSFSSTGMFFDRNNADGSFRYGANYAGTLLVEINKPKATKGTASLRLVPVSDSSPLPIQDVTVPFSSLGFSEANGNQGGVSIGLNLQLGEHGECIATYVAGVPTLSAAEAATFLQEADDGPPLPPEYKFQ